MLLPIFTKTTNEELITINSFRNEKNSINLLLCFLYIPFGLGDNITCGFRQDGLGWYV